MTKEELEKEAENFIIDRYKLNECYREDNAETREYMRMDVHSQYEEEYQLYLAVAEPREKRIAVLSKHIIDLQKDKGNLTDKVRELKILVSSLVYEINQIWDINEMNDDLRRCAEKIDREVQLSKMAEDNRMVISALGFAVVPPKPKVDVKEV